MAGLSCQTWTRVNAAPSVHLFRVCIHQSIHLQLCQFRFSSLGLSARSSHSTPRLNQVAYTQGSSFFGRSLAGYLLGQ